jgi:hypothetical protein
MMNRVNQDFWISQKTKFPDKNLNPARRRETQVQISVHPLLIRAWSASLLPAIP